jgi:hypothetical protein
MIDAHAHVPGDVPAVVDVLAELDVSVLNVSVGYDAEGCWRDLPISGTRIYGALARRDPERFGWCTSFDVPRPGDRDYAERIIAALETDFASGALACKVWKNIGMEVRGEAGQLVLVDDPLLTPVFEFLERTGKPLLAHIGEPLACWQPLDPTSPHYEYYLGSPEWHMHGRSDVHSPDELMRARDRLLARHPRLRVIGAHLGSLEYDVAEIAARLDRYPNFAVDTSGRLLDLARQDRGKIRDFLEKYADRVLFGTDMVFERAFSSLSPSELERSLTTVRQVYASELAFYSTGSELTYAGRTVHGLSLSRRTQEQLFGGSARRWLDFAPTE